MNTLFFAFWFFLPAGIANMMPVLVMKLPGLSDWKTPVDLGKSFGGVRILGDHKTIRGLVVGIFSGIVIAVIQYYVILAWPESIKGLFIPLNYMKGSPVVFGFLLSFGALFGDMVKSFFKRRVGVASGKTWFPFDQLDYIIGGIFVSLLFVQLNIETYIIIFILYFCLHLLSTTIGYFLGLKSSAL